MERCGAKNATISGAGSFEIQNENTNRVKSLNVKDSGMRVEEEKKGRQRGWKSHNASYVV